MDVEVVKAYKTINGKLFQTELEAMAENNRVYRRNQAANLAVLASGWDRDSRNGWMRIDQLIDHWESIKSIMETR